VAAMSEQPAAIFGLDGGKLEEGGRADFILFDPDEEWRVTPDVLRSRSKNSAFLGETLSGRVKATFLRGRLTWRDGEVSVE